jgi:prepilin-type processing-associated H-X9-DG protein
LDFNVGNLDNTNIALITNGPLYRYAGQSLEVYKCPSDKAATGKLPKFARITPRIRSISMSQVFDYGSWLDTGSGGPYRRYAKDGEIVSPTQTFIFVDEHPDSINDGAFAVQMIADGANSGNIIDMPAHYHNGACGFSFADGHSEIHRWIGKTIQPPIEYGNSGGISLNIPAKDSLVDAHWLSQNTTVKK